MKHELFFDGTVEQYTWSIKTESKIVNQIRKHPPAYISGGKLDVKNNEESKFIALHVGIYWGLGVFIIRDLDTVDVMCDSKEMHDILVSKCQTDNQIINDKIYFINQLATQRNLELNYHVIELVENIATKNLYAKDENSVSSNSRGFV